MFYNTKGFGNEIHQLRRSMNLSREALSDLTYIGIDTLKNIESGKVLPNLETLDIISVVLKRDLSQLLLQYRVDNPDNFDSIIKKVEDKFDAGDISSLKQDLPDLKSLLDTTTNNYIRRNISQFILLIKSSLSKKSGDLTEAYSLLISALSQGIPGFDMENYNKFSYSNIELRILLNIAMILNETKNKDKSLKIMNFCFENIDINSSLYPKISFNLSYQYHRLDIHEKAFQYANYGITYCETTGNFTGINHLYFRKGIAAFKLKHNDYKEILLKSIHLSEVLGQDNVKDLIIKNCKEMYSIDLDKSN